MNIHGIIYDTTRPLTNLSEKLGIATLVLFCYQIGSVKFSELLYCKDKSKFVNALNIEYSAYDVKFEVSLNNKLVLECLNRTLVEVARKYDNGFYKAVFNKDPYALAIVDITERVIKKFDIRAIAKEVGEQLSINFDN